MTAEGFQSFDTIIIGAGPIGLACAMELKRRGLRSLILEKGAVADAVRRFPSAMTFFSTSELIELGNLPLISHGPRPTRFEAYKYYTRVADAEALNIRRYSEAVSVSSTADGLKIATSDGHSLSAPTVILATGYFDQPNTLGVPGEDLPHVSHYYDEGLRYSRMKAIVVGGQNSACDTALDLFRAGADVTLVHRGEMLGRSVKYWVRPDIENRIQKGEIAARFAHELVAIAPEHVRVRDLRSGSIDEIPGSFVFLMTGYRPDVRLLKSAGVSVDAESLIPKFDAGSFETNVPGLYVAGSIIAGKRTSDIFIENGRIHASIIADHIRNRFER